MDVGQVYYDASSQWLLNLVLASMVLGVSLDIKWQDFRAVAKMPKAIVAGLTSQFLLLPAATTMLTLILNLPAGIELGMILVSACPGGAISNFVTHLAKGNTALSISMTAVASCLAVFLLPINFLFWSQLNSDTAALLQQVEVDASKLFINLMLVLALPLVIGLYLANSFAKAAKTLHKILNITSVIALCAFITVAVIKNQQAFLSHFELIFVVVLLHNALAYGLGFGAGKLSNLSHRDIKATTIEVGMQNSSLAVAIVFSQFDGQAGMALISAFWGTWHIVSGLLIALTFRRYFTSTSHLQSN